MERVCNGGKRVEKGILTQTHNVVAKYWGKGGILKWAEFIFSHASLFLEWDPNTFFSRKKI
jgi:hypothetical protein